MAAMPPEQVGYVPDKLKKAEKRIRTQSYDTEAWSVLIRDSQMKPIENARPVYEQLVEQFPTSGKYWRIYIEQELKAKNFERVEKLFQRCLVKVLNIDLWKLYLNYIKDTKGSLPSYREKMAQAYDFALDKMGMDIMSYQIWADYVNFLKSVEAVGSYAENQRITAVRKVYQRGVVNPMINIEIFWKEYCAYENSINPLIAKKMTEDRGREYMNSRRVAKEYEAVTRGINKNMPSIPPMNIPEEATQVGGFVEEVYFMGKSNPLKTEDHALITRRVMFAYEQCLLCLGHHPDIWYEAASYLEHSSRILTEKGDQNAGKMFADEAAAIYERSITTLMKSNMLLFFAYADFEEGRMKYEKVHTIYKRFLAMQDTDPTLGYIQYMKFARRAEGIKSARLVFKMARENNKTKYQVYVAAALMEYYCSKVRENVALKIFELGLKKYGGHPEYALCYMDFMSHLNEDNNTRVLYERVLSSGQILPEKSIEIWSRFLAFESEVGDLACIQKVEKRRAQAIEKVQEFEDKDTALLIDRYKYIDLYPCTQTELKAIGYYDLVKQQVVQAPSSSVTKAVMIEEDNKRQPEYPKPDIEQMLPFKPKAVVLPGSHPVSGGEFPPPPAAGSLMTVLPPPECFHGPFVIMDKFIEHMKNLTLPEAPIIIENGVEGLLRPDSGTQYSIDIALGRKRRITEGEDSDDENSETAPPLHDIYRSRQQKRIK